MVSNTLQDVPLLWHNILSRNDYRDEGERKESVIIIKLPWSLCSTVLTSGYYAKSAHIVHFSMSHDASTTAQRTSLSLYRPYTFQGWVNAPLKTTKW